MNAQRQCELLVGHALAERAPLGDTLRGGSEARIAAAAEIAAGRLEDGLQRLGMHTDLVRLACAWPEALRPAQRRLSRLPSPLVFHIPILVTLIYLSGVAVLQALVVLALSWPPVGSIAAIAVAADSPHVSYPGEVAAVLALVLFACLLGATLSLLPPGRLPGWGRHYRRAREAALAAGLAEAGAPAMAWREAAACFQVLTPGRASAEELEGVMEVALARAEVALARAVSAARLIGFGILGGVALAVTFSVYSAIAWLPGSL